MQKDILKNIYLPNLNGLRFIAAALVFICHVENVEKNFNLPNLADKPFFLIIGKLGVVIFFVLSGFLISYLMLSEQKETGTLNIKRFYLRRILRIWPLYFLIIIFALYIAPHSGFFHLPNCESALDSNSLFNVSILFFFFLPNQVYAAMGAVPYAVQTWSVGTEEQFYLLWPLLVKWSKRKGLVFVTVFVAYNVLKLVFIFFQHKSPVIKTILDFWYYFNIDCMALGGIGAYLVITQQEKILRLIYLLPVQLLTYAALILLMGFGIEFRYMHFEIYACLYAIAIINLASNKKSILNLENPVFNYLGKISYGIYMYHFIALTITIRMLQYFNIYDGALVYLVGFIVTVILSSLSYHYFESFFLNIKGKLSVFSNKKISNVTSL